MWDDSLASLGYSLIIVLGVSFIMSGLNIGVALIILLNVCMILINMGGLMYIWNISLNAVSLVNLVMVRFLLIFLHHICIYTYLLFYYIGIHF